LYTLTGSFSYRVSYNKFNRAIVSLYWYSVLYAYKILKQAVYKKPPPKRGFKQPNQPIIVNPTIHGLPWYPHLGQHCEQQCS